MDITTSTGPISLMVMGTLYKVSPVKIDSEAHVIKIDETEALKQATANWQKEAQAYGATNSAEFDPKQVYAQVLIEGKVAASINKDGSVQSPYDLSGVDLPKSGANAAEVTTENVSRFFAYVSKTIYSDFKTPAAINLQDKSPQPQALVDAENRLKTVVERLLMSTLHLSGNVESDPIHLSDQAISNYATYHLISKYQQVAAMAE